MLESEAEFEAAMSFAKDCEPNLVKASSNLYKELGTHFFSLCRIRAKYQVSFCIGTDIGEEWFRRGQVLIAPPSSGFYLLTQLRNFYDNELIEHLKVKYGLANVLYYVEHRKYNTDIYTFASEPNRPDVLNNYINRGSREILNFIPAFRENFKGVLREAEKTSFIYIQDDSVYQHPYFAALNKIEYTSSKYSSVELKKFEMNLRAIPDRTYDCIELAAAGLTAKESAKELQLHYRTIEGHIENAKIRLLVDSKQQLIDMFLTVAS